MIFLQTLDFIAIIFGFVLYFLALGISYLICVYPDPVKKSKLTDEQRAKAVLRKFFRSIFFKYLILLIGCYVLIKIGYDGLSLLSGLLIAIVFYRLFCFIFARIKK